MSPSGASIRPLRVRTDPASSKSLLGRATEGRTSRKPAGGPLSYFVRILPVSLESRAPATHRFRTTVACMSASDVLLFGATLRL